MKKQKSKKPTMREMEEVVISLVRESQLLRLSLLKTQEVLSDYIEFGKNTDKFTKYVREKDGKENKRDSNKGSDKK